MDATIVFGLLEVQDYFQKLLCRVKLLENFCEISECDKIQFVNFKDQEKFWVGQKKMIYGALKHIVDSQKDLYAKIEELKATDLGSSADSKTKESKDVGFNSLWDGNYKPSDAYDCHGNAIGHITKGKRSKVSLMGDQDGSCNGHNQRFESLENLATSNQTEIAAMKGKFWGIKNLFLLDLLSSLVLNFWKHGLSKTYFHPFLLGALLILAVFFIELSKILQR